MHGPKGRNLSKALRNNYDNTTLDVRGYRGNLYKQTLSPSWSKSKLREARDKYSKITDDARTNLTGSGLKNQSQRDVFLDSSLSGK